MIRKAVRGFYSLLVLGIAGFIEFILLINCLPHFDGLAVKLGIDPIKTLIVGLAGILIVRLVTKAPLSAKLFWFLFWIVVPFLMLVALVLTSTELINYHNFVFSHFHIRFDQVTMLAIGTSLVTFGLVPEKVWNKNWQKILFAAPVISLIGLALIWTWPNDVFNNLVKEDHLIENTQVLVLLIGCVLAFLISKFFWKRGQGSMAVLFFLVCLGLFFISGDEIDWGQRLIGFATPQKIAQENLQGEVTLHNIDGIHQLVGYGYTGIAFLWRFCLDHC